MSDGKRKSKYLPCICHKCRREYYYWPEKGLFNSRKFCPDCRVSLKSKAIHGLLIEEMACKSKPQDKSWADSKVIDILSANLTVKQQAAVKAFLDTGIVPRDKAANYYLAIKKLKAAGKAIFNGGENEIC